MKNWWEFSNEIASISTAYTQQSKKSSFMLIYSASEWTYCIRDMIILYNRIINLWVEGDLEDHQVEPFSLLRQSTNSVWFCQGHRQNLDWNLDFSLSKSKTHSPVTYCFTFETKVQFYIALQLFRSQVKHKDDNFQNAKHKVLPLHWWAMRHDYLKKNYPS